MFLDPTYKAYAKQVQELLTNYNGKYEDLACNYQALQNQYKNEHREAPPIMPKIQLFLDIEKKKSDMQANSAAAKRLAYSKSIPQPIEDDDEPQRQPITVREKMSHYWNEKQCLASFALSKVDDVDERWKILAKRKEKKRLQDLAPKPVVQKPLSRVEIAKQYAAELKSRPPDVRPRTSVTASKRQQISSKVSAPSVCEPKAGPSGISANQASKGMRRSTLSQPGAGMNLQPELQGQYQAQMKAYQVAKPRAKAAPICDAQEEEPIVTALERRKQFSSKIKAPALPTEPRKAPEKERTIRDVHKECEEKRINILIEEIRSGVPKPTYKPTAVSSIQSLPSLTAVQKQKQYASQIKPPTKTLSRMPSVGSNMGLAPELQQQYKAQMHAYQNVQQEPQVSALEKMRLYSSKVKAPPLPAVPRKAPEKAKSIRDKQKDYEALRVQREIEAPSLPVAPRKAPEPPAKTVREAQKEYEAKNRQRMLELEVEKKIVREAMADEGEHSEDKIGSFNKLAKKIKRQPRLKPMELSCKPSAAEIRKNYELQRKQQLAQATSKQSVCSAKAKLKPGEHPKPDDPKEKARKMKEYAEKHKAEIKQKQEDLVKALTEQREKLAKSSLKSSLIKKGDRKRTPKRVRISFVDPRGMGWKVVELPDYEEEPMECINPQLPDEDTRYTTEMLEKLQSKLKDDIEKIDKTIEEVALDQEHIDELEEEKEFLQLEFEFNENAVRDLPQARKKIFDSYMRKVEAAMAAGEDDAVKKNNLHNEYKQKLADLERGCGLPRPDVDNLAAMSTSNRPIVVDMEQVVRIIEEKRAETPRPAKIPPPSKKVQPKKVKSFVAIEEDKKKAALLEKKKIQENLSKMIAKQKDIKKTLQTIRKKPRDPRPEALLAPQEVFAETLKSQRDLESAVSTRLAKTKADPIRQSAIAREQADDIFKEMMIQDAGGDFAKDPADLGALLVQSVAPKLPLLGSAAEADINEGVLTKQIPTAEMNALNTIVNEEIGINIRLTDNIPIPATNVAHAAICDPQDILLDFAQRNPPTKEHHEVALTLDSFYVENHFQARGSAWPKWFPGFFTAFPGENTNVILQKSPSDVLYKAWEMLKPPYTDPRCARIEICG